MLASQEPSFLHPNGCTGTESLQAVLDCLDTAVFLLDNAARVSWRNRSAGQIIAAGDGLSLRGGRLSARWGSDNRRLAAALARRGLVTMRITRPSGRPGYVVHVHHLDRQESGEGADVVLLVNAPDQLDVSEAHLMNAYRLTPAEARVAQAVVLDGRLPDAARRLQLSINTVKSTLQRVFEKTEIRSQAQLVRLLVTTCCHAPPQPGGRQPTPGSYHTMKSPILRG